MGKKNLHFETEAELGRFLKEQGGGARLKPDYETTIKEITTYKPVARKVLTVDLPIAVPTLEEAVPRGHRMNKLERSYYNWMQRDTSVHSIRFEAITFLLGDDCRYTPDFFVQFKDGRVEIHETKARDKKTGKYRITEDAQVKIKIFPQLFPFPLLIKWPSEDGGWYSETIRP